MLTPGRSPPQTPHKAAGFPRNSRSLCHVSGSYDRSSFWHWSLSPCTKGGNEKNLLSRVAHHGQSLHLNLDGSPLTPSTSSKSSQTCKKNWYKNQKDHKPWTFASWKRRSFLPTQHTAVKKTVTATHWGKKSEKLKQKKLWVLQCEISRKSGMKFHVKFHEISS